MHRPLGTAITAIAAKPHCRLLRRGPGNRPVRTTAQVGSDPSGTWLIPALIGVGVYGVAIAGARELLNDGDTLSHIAIGRWIIAHHAIPFYDFFSFTARGGRWVPHEWLAEVVFASLYDRLGWGGVVAASGLAAATAFALLTSALALALGPARAAIGALAAFSLTEAHFLARPHALAWPLLVVWMSRLIRASDRGRTPSVALLPVIILWCNLHAGFVVGLLFVILMGLEAVARAAASTRLRTVGAWGMFLGLAALAALISPNGVAAVVLPINMLHMGFALASISEWTAVDFSQVNPLELWITLAILAGLGFGVRLPLSRTLMALLLLWMALTHTRNQELLGLVAPLLVAAPLAAQLPPPISDQKPLPPQSRRRRRVPRFTAPATLATAAILGFFATAWALDRGGLAPRQNVAPIAAVEAARRAGLDGHVFNAVRFGGYLMLENIPTFIDGRADLFGDAFVKRYITASNAIGNTLPDLLNEYRIAWTLLEPSTPGASLLDHLPGWCRIYADNYSVIHRRTILARCPSLQPAYLGSRLRRQSTDRVFADEGLHVADGGGGVRGVGFARHKAMIGVLKQP
jgi:hypothetical protein